MTERDRVDTADADQVVASPEPPPSAAPPLPAVPPSAAAPPASYRPREASEDRRSGWLVPALVYGGAALFGAALYQAKRAAEAEREHPPIGRFMDVDGTTLHYVDLGSGPPIVFIHGIGATLDDWFISGVLDPLFRQHRIIVLERPGYGYSKRPQRIAWTPERQARAFAEVLHRLGAHEAVVVGHSFGVLPAIALALQQRTFVRALVLLGGVYMPGASIGETARTIPSVPLIGPLARLTLAPSLSRAALPQLMASMFEPQPVPSEYRDRFPMGLATRAGQLQAAGDDARMIADATDRLSAHYGELDCPVTVLAGSGDAIFDPDEQSRRFADAVTHARLVVVPAAGHMVHHSAPERVAAAIADTFAGRIAEDDPGPPPDVEAGTLDDGAGSAAPDESGR